jgi:hypothetical protein
VCGNEVHEVRAGVFAVVAVHSSAYYSLARLSDFRPEGRSFGTAVS